VDIVTADGVSMLNLNWAGGGCELWTVRVADCYAGYLLCVRISAPMNLLTR